MGVFRDRLPFGEIPIKLYLRKRESSPGEQEPNDAGQDEEAHST